MRVQDLEEGVGREVDDVDRTGFEAWNCCRRSPAGTGIRVVELGALTEVPSRQRAGVRAPRAPSPQRTRG